jgi:alginate O-acetyltransferase complex protein AlgI
MLFQEESFLLIFLPIFLFVFFVLKKTKRKNLVIWITASSIVFYSIYNLGNVPVILFSIICNFIFGLLIKNNSSNGSLFLKLGILFNIIYLAFFKYLDFIIKNINSISSTEYNALNIELPLAISFFTFQQIAYLVDLKKGLIKVTSLKKYLAFVLFFPQLIAGPIVRFQQIIDQLNEEYLSKIRINYFQNGFCLFSLGLFKKHFIADGICPITDSLFVITDLGKIPSFAESWIGMTAFGLQIYFDFSAYSDMALGLALMIGINLPANFNSPYQATNIIDFWRKWHITLSQFLRDYIYIPLGGNRLGVPRSIFNSFLVMAIGGLWHGASWTFLCWGVFHGLIIGITHIAKSILKGKTSSLNRLVHYLLFNRYNLFIIITLSWVLFRSENFNQAKIIYESMLGMNGFDIGRSMEQITFGSQIRHQGFLPNQELDITLIPFIPVLLSIVWFVPNSNIFIYKDKYLERISTAKLIVCLVMFFLSVKLALENTSYEFIYFKF